MNRKRLLAATVIAFTAAIFPVTTRADRAVGLELSTAACEEAGCGYLSMADCFCPDLQMPNHKPQCDE